eukprot:32723-Pelagomonas_calceolata.AAC.1
MKELGCYTDGQRQEKDEADMWACPACAGLDITQKIDRECQSEEELIRAKRIRPLPTVADSALSNLEIQGFKKPHAINTGQQKLDTELRSKITFDIHPTNPQVDIQPT